MSQLKQSVLILLLLLFGGQSQATTQQAKQEALALAMVAIAAGGTVDNAYSVGFLPRGGTKVYQTVIQKGQPHVIIVGGCEDAYDVDLAVLDADGNVIDTDADYAKHALIEFRPRRTGVYYIVVKMAESTSNGAHYAQITAYP